LINFLLKFKTFAFTALALFFSLMWVLTLFLHGWAAPFPRLSPQKPLLLMGLAFLAFIFFMLVNKIALLLSKVQEKKFLFRVIGLYFLLQIAFVFLFPVNTYEDALIIDGIAKQFLKGNFLSLGIGNYLGYYPNNIGITLFFTLLYSFLPDSNISLRLINVIFNSISAVIIYKIYKELYPERQDKACGMLLLAVTFLPPIILNNFTYGDIFSNTFCLAAMLNALRYTRHRLGKYALYTTIFLMAGNFMRSVAFLFMAAIVLYWSTNLELKTKINIKNIAYAAMCILLFNVPIKAFSFIGVKTGIIAEPVGVHSNPVWRWINMGFPDKKLGYWDGGKNISIFVHRFKCNKHDAAIFFIDDLFSKIKTSGLHQVFRFYTKKTFWLWTEGTYSVNYYGLSQAVRAEHFVLYNTPLVKHVEPWDTAVRVSLDWLLHSFNWFVLGLVILYLFDSVRKQDLRMELFVYVILLYLGFYLLWEVKSRYIFGVYPIFLTMSYVYSEKIFDYLNGRLLKHKWQASEKYQKNKMYK
jgi:hypothetical protein